MCIVLLQRWQVHTWSRDWKAYVVVDQAGIVSQPTISQELKLEAPNSRELWCNWAQTSYCCEQFWSLSSSFQTFNTFYHSFYLNWILLHKQLLQGQNHQNHTWLMYLACCLHSIIHQQTRARLIITLKVGGKQSNLFATTKLKPVH